jgi:hypothetical protein
MSASVAGVSAAAGSGGGLPAPEAPKPLPHTNRLATLSASELRTGMQQHFRANGTLQQLKTQLRGMMLTDLLQQPTTARLLVAGTAQSFPPNASFSSGGGGSLEDRAANPVSPDVGVPARAAAAGPFSATAVGVVPRRADHTLQTWSCGLADALVENHLRRTRRAMSLSIFSTEAEVPPFSTSGAPSEEEQYLVHLFRQDGGTTSPNSSPAAEDEFLAPSPSRSVKSVLQRLVEDCVTHRGLLGNDRGEGAGAVHHLHSCSTQTDAADSDDGTTNPLNSLECRLAAVDAKYALTFAQLRRTGATGEQPFFLRSEVERRLAQYKSDMHAQLRSEYEQKYNTFTRVKLQEARDEADQRYRVLVRSKAEEFAEMERSVMTKLEQERERLKLSWEDVHQQRLEMERRQRDMATQLAEQEAAQRQAAEEMHKVKETCRVLRLQCAKWEELCATRLMELDGARSREERRVEDLRRLQAEHASELRLKDEEVDRLRYRIRLLGRDIQVPPLSPAKEEDATLSSMKEKAGSAATAGNGGSSAGGSGTPVDAKQLYGLLLRTEELQRNAVLQQQQQQQRWDAAWVAATAAPAHIDTPTLRTTGPGSSPLPTAALPAASTTPAAQVSGSLKVSTNAILAAAPATTPTASTTTTSPGTAAAEAAPAESIAASPSLPSPSEITTTSADAFIAADAAGKTTSSPPSPPIATPVAAAPQPATSRQASSSTTRTATTPTTTESKDSKSAKTSSAPSAGSSPVASKSFRAKSSSTSLSATPQKTPVKDGAALQSASRNAVAFLETEAEEDRARNEVVSEEDTARAGIVWSENNKRTILEETLRQAKASSDDDGEGGGGTTRPWERPGVAAAALGAPTLGGGTVFDDDFSTDDDALIRSSTEDDSDF